MLIRFRIAIALLFSMILHASAQDAVTYQLPPQAMQDLLLASPTPSVSISNNGEWMLIMQNGGLPTLEELAQPELRIAGIRINPTTFGPSRISYYTGFKLKNIRSGNEYDIKGLPIDMKAVYVQWNPSDKKIAFCNIYSNGIDLYVIIVEEKKAVKVNFDPVNASMGMPYLWSDNDDIIYKSVDKSKVVSRKAPLPKGPVVQENLGKSIQSRTYQDLLKNAYDESLFEYYASSQLKKTGVRGDRKFGMPGIYANMSLSPDKNYLLIKRIERPYSYLLPAINFPHSWQVWNVNDGTLLKMLFNNPSSEGTGIGFDDVVSFPRNIEWRSDEAASIFYVQALDSGMSKRKVEYLDALYTWKVPFNHAATEISRTKMRFRDIVWGHANLAIVNEGSASMRIIRMNKLDPSTGQLDSIFQRSSNDLYADIGLPMTTRNEWGENTLLLLNNTQLLLRSNGASPQGDMPFLQTYDLNSKKYTMLWRCQAPYYETPVRIMDAEKMTVLTSRESENEPPNYFIRDIKKNKLNAITAFTDPQPSLRQLQREKISYKRSDGIDLNGTLYLPKGYDAKKDGPLPVLIWAYPNEYRSAADAAQVRGSQYTFTRINGSSPVYFAMAGYAVLQNASMPIVSLSGKEPNDHFIEQLQWNAAAAIRKLAEMGVGDSNRVAIGGHSYGAFMTVNLLAHTNLFKAGIAESGAYNRTLTPFGFQGEERTYWQAPEVYNRMSPFNYADKIKTPLLLIHGDADNNSGTFPIQSERLFAAIKGHGGIVRYVSLPFEAHVYRAKENLLHTIWEEFQWLEKYVKNHH
jgi:dipeptidyl aminopeptidase/acylaminoacyl peptidase